MNAAQITHIFWKEYRTQRSLWLATVLLFLVTAVMSVLFLPEQNQPDVSSLLLSAMVTVTFYSLASSSILYASEKEQKTDVFLRTLPTNPWLMLGVKAGWVLLSSVLAMTIFSGAAYLFAEPGRIATRDVNFAVQAFVFVACCSLVASLLTRHVFSAIGLSVSLMLGSLILGETLDTYDWLPASWEEHYFTSTAFLLIAISLELNRRWFRESDRSWGRGIRFGRAMSMPAALALPVESSPNGRIWSRHFWREWQSARVWLLGISALSILLIRWIDRDRDPDAIRFFLFAIVVMLVPLLFGVGSCRGDQAQERYQFLGNRGDSALRVLLTKHAVWMSGGFLLIVFLQLFTWPDYSSLLSSYQVDEFTGGLRFIPFRTSLMSSSRIEQLSGSLIPGLQFCAGIALLLYCLGHFFSVSISQPVMSLLTAVFAGLFVTFMVCVFYVMDVPLFVLTVAPAICLLSLSFYRGNDWIVGDRSLRSWKRLACWSLLGMWTLISLMAAWRVAEIPMSTVIDLTGLRNIPAYYFSGCAVLFAITLILLVFVDWFRRNFSDSAGRPLLGVGRFCTFGRVIGTFFVAHNLLLLSALLAFERDTQSLAAPMRLAAENDLLEQNTDAQDLYQTADESVTSPFPLPEEFTRNSPEHNQKQYFDRVRAYYEWNVWSEVTEEQRLWLEGNQEILPLFFEADRNGYAQSRVLRPTGEDGVAPIASAPLSFLHTNQKLILLVRLQALKLEHEGRLDEAWKHHLAVIRYARRFADDNFPVARMEVLNWLNVRMMNGDLWRWQARKEQTPELLARAVTELHREFSQLTPLADAYRLEGGSSLTFLDFLSPVKLIAQEQLLAPLPWERQRLRAIIVESTAQNADFAERIDDGLVVKLEPYYFGESDDRELYWLRNSKTQVPDPREAILATHPRSGQVPELLLVSEEFGVQGQLGTETRPLMDVSTKAETTPILMDAPENVSVLGIVNQPPANVLQAELDFWSTLDLWIADAFLYSYRAETGQFPAHLGELHQAQRTRELFTPHSENLSVDRGLQSSSLRTGINTALSQHRDRFAPESSTYSYNWFHASKWPQPEYNFGKTPDRKPSVPLQAPKPVEIQP